MRLFTKIFLFGMLVFGAAFSVSGYFLLRYSLESSMAREVDFALKQYQYDKFTVQSAIITHSSVSITMVIDPDSLSEDGQNDTLWPPFSEEQPSLPESFIQNDLLQDDSFVFWQVKPDSFFSALAAEITLPSGFFQEDKTLLYSEIDGIEDSFLDSLSKDSHTYQFQSTENGGSLLVGSILEWDGLPASGLQEDDGSSGLRSVYFVTQWDIGKTLQQQDTLQRYFVRCYLIAMGAGTVLLGLLSAFLTGPLKKMSLAAHRMAEGDYHERLSRKGGDEIGNLAESFNQMAAAVEEKVGELEKAAREKEDFVANFAHELKTPLTSIIGYADTVYQKELPREDVKKASWHIWNEGMRLEALSLKLMELIVLGRQDFPLTEMKADELLTDAAEGLSPLFQEKQIVFCLQADPAYIRADYDLLKTLLINLLDNSIKAGSSRIELQGLKKEDMYCIRVCDNGCGMEEDELSRITEAFYMVDKARSRQQHGAGLGLALADRIAGIHGQKLQFESRKGKGTKVSLTLRCMGEE